jgi:hypothetical protein
MAEMRDKVTPAIAGELRSTARVKLFWHVRSAKGPRRRWVTGDDFEIPMPLLCGHATALGNYAMLCVLQRRAGTNAIGWPIRSRFPCR